MPDVRDVLLGQYDIARSLFEYHMAALTDEDLFWSPSAHRWTMHDVGGRWRPDLAETEPDPVPVPTIAWLTWHMGWWSQSATAHLQQTAAPSPEQAGWPGARASAIVDWLQAIHNAWRVALAGAQRLDAEATYPWEPGSGRTVADMAAWFNVELTKNASEIGQLLIIRRAGISRRA